MKNQIRNRIVFGILLIAIAAVMVSSQLFRNRKAAESDSSVQLYDAAGEPFDFSTYSGKVVFINNWATWCPPCVAEMPSIDQLKKKIGTEQIVFVMVSYDEERDKAIDFMKKHGYALDVFFPGSAYPYSTMSLPATFILDKKGNVVSKIEGITDYNADEFVEQLKILSQ